MVRIRSGTHQVLLAHPGGPFWRNKDKGAWTIPKGLCEAGEDPLAAAKREFLEETGIEPRGPFHSLGTIRQKSGKEVQAWAFSGDCDPSAIKSNLCEVEWPPRSRRTILIPEIDKAAFFTLAEAREKILPAQLPLLERLEQSFPA